MDGFFVAVGNNDFIVIVGCVIIDCIDKFGDAF